MCNRARMLGEPETIRERFGAKWLADRPMDNRFHPQELVPFGRAYVVREDDRGRGVDVMAWDVLGGQAKRPAKVGTPPRPLAMTNVRQLNLPQWRRLAEKPENRCIIPLTEFCEWSRDKDPEMGIKGEMWFATTDQPIFGVAGFWQMIGDKPGFSMVTCDANEMVKPIHPKAMITILREDDWDRWLTGSYEDAVALQRPYPADLMTVRGPVFPTRTTK
ncbi:SOS response-associated peptidase family protein [Sphingomonas abietis]|uniref:Abasic site processing protein n=1 Tax=Sphingomonas abietis TaxID=3012344 RepID=A0ABY7NTZ3_9SPHN|nr:SOS response-associated peptidase family protein [Sphingomonas abietis]WBO23911.1 SOS response-associated peptidase family protein [Sphingomonas abietis]